MKIVMIVPRVVEKYLSQFPEYTQNAYHYFNYDRRVIDERVNRGDRPSTYTGPDEFCDADYDALLMFAGTLINPILQKYSAQVAAEDALNQAIRSYANGRFDGKVNANKFAVLAKALMAGGVKLDPAPVSHHMDHGQHTAAKKRTGNPEPTTPSKLSKPVEKALGVDPKSLSKLPGKKTTLVKVPGGVAVQAPDQMAGRVAAAFAQVA